MYYLLEVREQVTAHLKETNPKTRVADVTKVISAQWQAMTPEQKQVRTLTLLD